VPSLATRTLAILGEDRVKNLKLAGLSATRR
jgi:hypothetical protein